MGSAANPNIWAPYGTYRDCSQGICSLYCPQWCYIVFAPPPPFLLSEKNHPSADHSLLIISVIGILASAFVLISYCTIISKYCKQPGNDSADTGENPPELSNEQFQSSTTGLEESVIKSITVCKYKKGDGFVDGTDCAVCLSEFEENERLRLLPKCRHAFHLPCIDTWLKSHSSCPLCRANIAVTVNRSSAFMCRYETQSVMVVEDLESGLRVEEGVVEHSEDGNFPFTRSVSFDASLRQWQVLIADILQDRDDDNDDDDDSQMGILQSAMESGSSTENGKGNNGNGVLSMIRSPLMMKRSISTEKFMFTETGKGRNSANTDN